ncbi:hypothetical protein ILFOPFJJ_01652 [Ensifer psoraleae]|uniref:hypothetical protein n=1 Tax=Sinorhizobium psoraleae TaxID=520838 RepID=UPI00156845B5|nr:hypothetical protein [Sinorhizobium psoraleae]NRP70770.1 hypothetical protein [Sinorhizobium psoraleae]
MRYKVTAYSDAPVEHLNLPFDPAGYGDFSVLFDDTQLKVRFEYRVDGVDRLGEIQFDFCVEYRVSGVLSTHAEMGYDCIYIAGDVEYEEWQLKQYVFMLSGSDFQFNVTAKSCTFSG